MANELTLQCLPLCITTVWFQATSGAMQLLVQEHDLQEQHDLHQPQVAEGILGQQQQQQQQRQQQQQPMAMRPLRAPRLGKAGLMDVISQAWNLPNCYQQQPLDDGEDEAGQLGARAAAALASSDDGGNEAGSAAGDSGADSVDSKGNTALHRWLEQQMLDYANPPGGREIIRRMPSFSDSDFEGERQELLSCVRWVPHS
jgi:hypothetical protein